nr:MAG TPA: hypothetical protein [Caudoviricetes sp.]
MVGVVLFEWIIHQRICCRCKSSNRSYLLLS